MGNDVIGYARLESAHGDHRHVQRRHIARHNGLQPHDDGCTCDHWISAEVGHGAVAALAFDVHHDVFARRHGRALAQQQLALAKARHVVHGKNRIARKALKQAVFHHLARTAQAFFGRLKNQVQGSVKACAVGQVFGRSQQHGGVAVVAAGVHQAGVAAGIGQAGRLVDRQRVHVGAQAQPARTRAALELPHHARAAQAASNGVAPALQPLGHQVTGAKLLKTDFWVLVDVAAQRREGICACFQG